MNVPLDQVPLNTATAKPWLELLLAAAGVPLYPESSLPVFLQWAALPAQHIDGGVSFQVALIVEGSDSPLLSLSLLRELTDPDPHALPDQPAATFTEQVGLQWNYLLESEAGVTVQELWADEFESIETFVETVRNLPEWQLALTQRDLSQEGMVVSLHP